MTLDEYFSGNTFARQLFDTLLAAANTFGVVELRVGKSQVALRRDKTFAWAWMPGKYLHGKLAPLVLSLALHHRDPSQRWKEVVEPYPGHFTHHLELYAVKDIDAEVCTWLKEAWEEAG